MTCMPREDSDQPGHPLVWLESSLCAQWVAQDPRFFMPTAKTDRNGWMPRLIWVFAGHKGHLVGFIILWLNYDMDHVKRIWYLSPMRAAKVQASLRIRTVSPEPPLLAHTSSESRGTFRQKARSLAPLNVWACAVKICHDRMLEDTNSLDGAHMFLCLWFHVFWLSAFYGMIHHRGSFATYLLAIFISNLLLYMLDYLLMKVWQTEVWSFSSVWVIRNQSCHKLRRKK